MSLEVEVVLSTLAELFDQQRGQLRQRLHQEQQPEQVVRELKSWLGSLLAFAGQEKERSLTERRVLGFLLDVITAAVSTLTSCEHTDTRQDWFTTHARRFAVTRGDWSLRIIRVVLAAVLFGVLYELGTILGLALLLVLILIDVREWFLKPSPRAMPTALPPSDAEVHVNLDLLLSGLRETLRTTDTILAEVSKPAPPSMSSLTDDHALLELFQELLHAASVNDGRFALKQLDSLAFLLEQHGIVAKPFTTEDAQFFDAIPSLDTKVRTWVTLKPAFVRKDGKLLKRGLAAEPTSP
ncbi:MAG: hypothetical protein AB7G75_17900 [Candidatus Binatia bacterium]